MFELIESVVVAKSGVADTCEDVVRDGTHWLAVCDGVTDHTGLRYGADDQTGGLLAARAVATAVAELTAGVGAEEVVRQAIDGYRDALGPPPYDPRAPEPPACSFVAVDKTAGRIVRVGDVGWRTAEEENLPRTQVDEVTSAVRATYLRALLLGGATEADLRDDDPGRSLILPVIRAQARLRNNDAAGDLGFGVIDGGPVPDRFIECWQVGGHVEWIVVGTDGYPRLLATLAETEDYLAASLAEDPLRIGRHPSTKGLRPGNLSYDDRAYVRLRR